MEEAFDTVVRRQSQTSVIDRKRADETLKPFMGALKAGTPRQRICAA